MICHSKTAFGLSVNKPSTIFSTIISSPSASPEIGENDIFFNFEFFTPLSAKSLISLLFLRFYGKFCSLGEKYHYRYQNLHFNHYLLTLPCRPECQWENMKTWANLHVTFYVTLTRAKCLKKVWAWLPEIVGYTIYQHACSS